MKKTPMRKKLFLFSTAAVSIHFLFIFATSQPSKNIISPFSEVGNSLHAADALLTATEDKVSTTTTTTAVTTIDPAKNNSSVYDELKLQDLGLSRYAFDYAL